MIVNENYTLADSPFELNNFQVIVEALVQEIKGEMIEEASKKNR